MNVLLQQNELRAYEVQGYPFLIVELSGMLGTDQYKNLLTLPALHSLVTSGGYRKILLELNQLWSVGTETQEYTCKEFSAAMKSSGVEKISIAIADHVYPMFSMMAGGFEKQSAVPLKYFGDLQQAAGWLVSA